MIKEYDDIIHQHYKDVANKHGLSSTSTMADTVTRKLETDAIIQFVGETLRSRSNTDASSGPMVIMDVGCGNGYTLETLLSRFPGHRYVGIEKSDELRSLASLRFKGNADITILSGDIRARDFANRVVADILICQRVLINLLDREDQNIALSNIVSTVTSPSSTTMGGALLFIECFSTSLAHLNEARSEFELPPIPPADHNLYLPDDFFDIPQLHPFRSDRLLAPPNFLSTHYYVTRVFHAYYTQGKSLKRNSEFVSFFSQALNQNVGDYSPLKLYMFRKAGDV